MGSFADAPAAPVAPTDPRSPVCPGSPAGPRNPRGPLDPRGLTHSFLSDVLEREMDELTS
jgi:hypothetical protein